MLKKNLKKIIITSLIILLPMLFGLIMWDRLPAELPTHFGLSGEPDDYSSKGFVVFGMPLVLLAFHLICTVATSLDPKHKNIDNKPFTLVLFSVPAISLIVNAITYSHGLGYALNAGVVMPAFMGVLFIIIGNYLPKCRQNYTIGIKIPWTLNDEEIWNKTHRFAGKLWVICGVISFPLAFTRFNYVIFAFIAIMTVVPIAYAYILYKNKGQSN